MSLKTTDFFLFVDEFPYFFSFKEKMMVDDECKNGQPYSESGDDGDDMADYDDELLSIFDKWLGAYSEKQRVYSFHIFWLISVVPHG